MFNKKKKNPIYLEYSENKPEKEMSKNVSIYILTCLLCVLLIYLVSMRFINKHNIEISENNTAFSTEYVETEAASDGLMININTDNIYELTLLPGIGTSKAEAIIEYRRENGDFTQLEELMNIKGIGESTFNKLKPYICVENNSEENIQTNAE